MTQPLHTKIPHCAVALLGLVLFVSGCEAGKSANPTSPSVAGPIAGVNISSPTPVQPTQGATISAKEQPIALVVANSSTNSQRVVTYTFEIAVDREFTSKVFTREGIPPGTDGRTSMRLPDALAADRTYYWRARAVDGANSSDYSPAVNFQIVTPVEIQAPVCLYPIGGGRVTSMSPEFGVANAARSGPTGQMSYVFEISENEPFTAMVAVVTIGEQANQTKFTLTQNLKNDTKYFWRVRAFDSNTAGPWSYTQSFVTPAVVVPPPPGPKPPPGSYPDCNPRVDCTNLVEVIRDEVGNVTTEHQAFEVTKRVAWQLRGKGVGLLIKDGGENIIYWNGKWFSISRICFPDGQIFKILSDAGNGGANGAGWAENGYVEPNRYVPAMDPYK